jgi:hypothetical protein
MAEILQELLNDAEARNNGSVHARLVEDTTAGTPWWNG